MKKEEKERLLKNASDYAEAMLEDTEAGLFILGATYVLGILEQEAKARKEAFERDHKAKLEQLAKDLSTRQKGAKQAADLFAAAPDLLEALEAMVERFKYTDEGYMKADVLKEKAKLAIAKAKGAKA
jgi:hypothetical protein